MKKKKHKQMLKVPGQNGPGAEDNLTASRKWFVVLFLLVLLSSITLKIYKADHAGMIFDERANFVIYGRSLDTALGKFDSTNNHVLNSVFMYYAYKSFRSYEHFIRIPSLAAGIMFSLTIAYIIYKTVRSNTLRIVSLAMVSLVPYAFNYSFLARGYAFALGGIYTAIAFVLWLIDHKIKFRYWPVPVLVISILNFVVLGAMLSAVLMVTAFNIVFILFFSHRIFCSITNKLKPIILNLVSIPLVSFISLFLLYQRVYMKLSTTSTIAKYNRWWKGWPSLVDYFYTLLVKRVFDLGDSFGYIILYSVVLLLVIAVTYHIFRFITSLKAGARQKLFKEYGSASFAMILLGFTLIIMFIYGVIMKRSLGLHRSQVFFIPLVLICAVITLDRFAYSLKKNVISYTTYAVTIVLAATITMRNLPSPYRISSTTMSKPLLRKLRTIDPNKTWNIAFSKKMESHNIGFMYYWLFDYKFRILREPGGHDIYICRKDERGPGVVCLDWDYYSKVNVAVVVNCKLPDDKVVISARPIEN